MIKNQHFSKDVKNVYYFSCLSKSLDLNWHESFPNIAVSYFQGLPSPQFYANVEPQSVVVIDDQWESCIQDPGITRAFKVDSRHKQFAIILITQSLFEQGKWGKTIRLNTEVFILFRNYGDAKTNRKGL